MGDLGTIGDKYDIAISTACPALNSIVVETTKDAQNCVNYLREKKLGRATFMILEKQQHLLKVFDPKMKTPFDVPRLIDLVKPNDKIYLPAFYHALRDTLVNYFFNFFLFFLFFFIYLNRLQPTLTKHQKLHMIKIKGKSKKINKIKIKKKNLKKQKKNKDGE